MSGFDYIDAVERHLDWVGNEAKSCVRSAKNALAYARRADMPAFETKAEDVLNRAENDLREALNALQATRKTLRPSLHMEAAE